LSNKIFERPHVSVFSYFIGRNLNETCSFSSSRGLTFELLIWQTTQGICDLVCILVIYFLWLRDTWGKILCLFPCKYFSFTWHHKSRTTTALHYDKLIFTIASCRVVNNLNKRCGYRDGFLRQGHNTLSLFYLNTYIIVRNL
jgi:hypothetical protein